MCHIDVFQYKGCTCRAVTLYSFCSDLILYYPDAFKRQYKLKHVTFLRRGLDISLDGIDFVSADVDCTYVPKNLPCVCVPTWVASDVKCPFCGDVRRREMLDNILSAQAEEGGEVLSGEEGEIEEARARFRRDLWGEINEVESGWSQEEDSKSDDRLDGLSDTDEEMSTAALVAEHDGSAPEMLVEDGERADLTASAASLASSAPRSSGEHDQDGRSVAGGTTSQAVA